MALLSALVVAAIFLTGCQTSSPSQYIAPRVIGRVLDAKTGQPIAGVQVRRLTPDQEPNVDQGIKGGQRVEQTPTVRTSSDGSFVLVSDKSLALFQRIGWYSVSLAFIHPNFERLTIEFTLVNATNTPTGEPLVRAGDVRLQPKSSSAN